MNYALSNIHGNQRRFHSVLNQIHLRPEDTLYMIDRHSDGLRILREIMAMPNAKMLLGNHAYMMMWALREPYDGPEDILEADSHTLLGLWYRNHGDVTHARWKHIRKTARADILNYLKALPLNIDITVEGKSTSWSTPLPSTPLTGSKQAGPLLTSRYGTERQSFACALQTARQAGGPGAGQAGPP